MARLPDYGLTISGLTEALGVSLQTINELLRGWRAVSPQMVLGLSRLFGNSAEFWLNAQQAVDFGMLLRPPRPRSGG
jgi:addiction module HigA family antidote